MCLLAFALNVSARWPLVIASNRDEFFDRPALPLAQWQTGSGKTMVSGRDLRAGGAWFGATLDGRVALLTNVRESGALLPAARSRGELVMRWLDGDMDAVQFMAETDSSAYAGFNLVLGDWQKMSWTALSNRRFDNTSPHSQKRDRPVQSGWVHQTLGPGIYGLSNAALDTPWPKTRALKNALAQALAQADRPDGDEKVWAAALWTALLDRQKADIADLPDTGLPVELEKALSSAFVSEAGRGQTGYGTRCSTLLMARAENLAGQAVRWSLSMDEKTYPEPENQWPDESPCAAASQRHETFCWQQL